MEQLLTISKRFFSLILIFFVGISLIFGSTGVAVFAQTVQEPTGSQGATQVNGNQSPSGSQSLSLSEQGAMNGIAGCASSVVGGVVSQLTLGLFKRSSTENYTKVGTFSNQDVARAGGSVGWPPSLDSIGYCIINAVIDMLTQATIDWINTGFDGNPAFVSNPEQFFKDIGTTEAAHFLQGVVGGATGINICEPFRLQITTGMANTYNPNDFNNRSRCTLDDISSAVNNSGASVDVLDDMWNRTQNPQNNIFGAYFMTQQELQRRVAIKNNTAQVDMTMGRGFLSFKECNPDSTTTGLKGETVQVKGACRTTTPGGVIEDQLNKQLGAGKERLVLADKFDQVITSLVNQLIKTALNETLNSSNE